MVVEDKKLNQVDYGGATSFLGSAVGGMKANSKLAKASSKVNVNASANAKPSITTQAKNLLNKAKEKTQNTVSTVKDKVKTVQMDNRGSVDLKAFSKSGKKALLSGEGKVGTYNQLKKLGTPGDNLTPHHMPSAEYIKSKGGSYGNSATMWMEQPYPGNGGRHRGTFTYGKRTSLPEMQGYFKLSSRDALAFDLWDAKAQYMKDGLYNSEIRQSFRDIIGLNKELYPDLFKK